jgi:hypothetical protein
MDFAVMAVWVAELSGVLADGDVKTAKRENS